MPKSKLNGYWLFVIELAEQHGVHPCEMEETADPLWKSIPVETQDLYRHRAKLERGPPRPCQGSDCVNLEQKYIAYVTKTKETINEVRHGLNKLVEENMDL